jgi:ribosomal protein S27AE
LASERQQSQAHTERHCPHCGSQETSLTQRGYAGATDGDDQFFSCGSCGRTTFEILSRSPREIRIGRLEPGRAIRHAGEEYTVSRVLKVGLNESLVYVKPVPNPEHPPAPRGIRRATAT